MTLYVRCPLRDGVCGRVSGPGRVASHTFTLAEATPLLESFAVDDFEDGPRRLREVLREMSR
jgi:hypothetical protein